MGVWYTFDTKSDTMARKIRRALRSVHTVHGAERRTFALIGNGESRWLRKMEASLAVVVRVAAHPGPTIKSACGTVFIDSVVGRGQTLVGLHQRRCKACRALLAVLTITGPDPAPAVETPPTEPTEPVEAIDTVVPSPEITGLGPSIQALSQIQEQAFTLATEAESAITACKRALDAEARLKELQRRATAQQNALQALVADLSGRLRRKGE